MAKPPDDVTAFLATYPAPVGEIALRLRKTVLSAIPGALEMLDLSGKVIGYGFGSGYSDLICTIIPSRTGVKLGVVGGADLPDPGRLLEGAGKRHRYVAFAESADLERPGLARLLEAALAAWKARAEKRKD